MVRSGRVLIAAVLVCTAALYGRVVSYPFLHWDDPRYVNERPTMQRLAAGDDRAFLALLSPPRPGEFWEFYPLRDLSYGIEARIFGLDPAAFHSVNLLVHLATILLIFAAAARLVSPLPAALAALFFAVHPLTVEPVAWVSGRKDLLSTLFVMLSLYLWLRSLKSRALSLDIGLVVAAIAAMLSKGPGAIAAPILLFLTLRHPATRAHRRQQLLCALLCTLAIAWVAFAIWMGKQNGIVVRDVGAPASVWLALGAVSHAVERALFPLFLSPAYEPSSQLGFDVRVLTSMAVVGAIGFALYRSFRSHPFGRPLSDLVATKRPMALSASFAFASGLAIVPTSGIVSVAQHRADRFAYLPLALACVALAPWIAKLVEATVEHRRSRFRAFALVAAVVALAAYATQTHRYLDVWRDDVTLWKAVLKHAPDHPIANGQLGALALAQGHFALAERLIRRAIKRRPDLATGYCNLGRLYRYRAKASTTPTAKRELYRRAEAMFRAALDREPTHRNARAELGLVLGRLGKTSLAIDTLRRALAQPEPPLSAAFYLGELLFARDKRQARQIVLLQCRRRGHPPACQTWLNAHR